MRQFFSGTRAATMFVTICLQMGISHAYADFILHYKGQALDQSRCHANTSKKCLSGNVYATLFYTGTVPSNYTGYIGDRNGTQYKHGFIGATDAYKVVIASPVSMHLTNGRPDKWFVNTSNEAPNCDGVHRHFETTDTDDIVDAYQRVCPPTFRIYGNVRSPGQWRIEPDQDE